MQSILIIDDDGEFRKYLREILRDAGYEVEEAALATEAFEVLSRKGFDIVLLDYLMPKKSGIDALEEIKRLQPRAKVIMITAFASIENAVEAIKKGACDYVAKPFKIESLLLTIKMALEEAKFDRGIKKLNLDYTLSALASPIRRNILKLINEGISTRLMGITRQLKIEDHTKVVFHLRMLKDAGLIDQDEDKAYFLTAEGALMLECLQTIERFLNRNVPR